MSSSFGYNPRVTIFGESHGEGVGCVIDGLPAALAIDLEAVAADLKRRAPGGGETVTPRRESDEFVITSGVFGGKTTGAPLCAATRNADVRSGDYEPLIPRPGHADYPAYIKWRGMNDYRGGGRFSGRLTAPLVFAGSIVKQLLCFSCGVSVSARVESVHGKYLPDDINAEILQAKTRGDSVGGAVLCVIKGAPIGMGEPFFDSIESVISHMIFSIPAVKGVEFGDGFAFAELLGSEVSDGYKMTDGRVSSIDNHNGGVLGGLSNGNDIVFRTVFKPTPTISKEQRTVDLSDNSDIIKSFGGRHDPCVVTRAAVVVECAAAIALAQFTPRRDIAEGLTEL